MDPRATQLADILLHHSLDLKKGDKLLISASDLHALELLQECYRLAVLDGAYVELDVMGTQLDRGRSSTGGFLRSFLEHANDEQLTTVSDVTKFKIDWADKLLSIITVQDDLFLADIDPARVTAWKGARFPVTKKVLDKRWVLTEFPTENLAARAGMSLHDFTEFYYQASIVDYVAQGKRIQALQDILDAGSTVRVVGPGTDLTLGIEGRLAAGADSGACNVPDGECFIAPLEDKTSGVVTFELPQVRDGSLCRGIRLEFTGGAIVNATAEEGQDFLLKTLDDHPGNRRFGELGIGMNDRITKYLRNILFDEKIMGTVHMALGMSYSAPRGGGKNDGSTHWDLVKDLRFPGTSIEVDGRAILRDGKILV